MPYLYDVSNDLMDRANRDGDKPVTIKQSTLAAMLASYWDCEHMTIELFNMMIRSNIKYEMLPYMRDFETIQRTSIDTISELLELMAAKER